MLICCIFKEGGAVHLYIGIIIGCGVNVGVHIQTYTVIWSGVKFDTILDDTKDLMRCYLITFYTQGWLSFTMSGVSWNNPQICHFQTWSDLHSSPTWYIHKYILECCEFVLEINTQVQFISTSLDLHSHPTWYIFKYIQVLQVRFLKQHQGVRLVHTS